MLTFRRQPWGHLGLLVVVLILAGYLRLGGSDWGELQHQQPDENHLTSVLESLRGHRCADRSVPIDDCPADQKRLLGPLEYLDTRTSTLNPYNRGFSFYVYGNLPLTIMRVIAEATNQTELRRFGRQASAVADLVSLFLLYLIAARLYGRPVAVLATLFSALSVMQIQQSHYLSVDMFVNAFGLAAVYCAVRIVLAGEAEDHARGKRRDVLLSVGFGATYAMALASKVSIFPLALLLPAAFLLRPTRDWRLIGGCLSIGALAALVTFRFCQPYAFIGLDLNPQWLANITEQRAQASGDADTPWNLQWARRSPFFSFSNLTLWGLGLPLGLLAWGGFLHMAWRIAKGERRHLLLWGWTAAYFLWQSLQFNPTMRYQLPIYPLLAMMAAWFITRIALASRGAAALAGIIVVVSTAAWAFAFHGIYLRDEPRIAATRWIFQHVPGPANLRIRIADNSHYNQPLTAVAGPLLAVSNSSSFTFRAARDGHLESIFLPHVRTDPTGHGERTVEAVLSTPASEGVLARAVATVRSGSDVDPRGAPVRLALDGSPRLSRGAQYTLSIRAPGGSIELEAASFANETDFDYSLPMRIDGYDPFGGIYRGDLNLQVYWDDNEEKRERLAATLEASDFIFIPTNHQYAQITRLPERYPLTTEYYRELVGCPPAEEIIGCYQRAQPGTFDGRLGFELAAVFESFPRLGPLSINDQSAEEAFTFYDHPKVLIFRKSAEFDASHVRRVLGAVDLTRTVRLQPREFDDYQDLLLTGRALERQRAGGTWSELFRYASPINAWPFAAAVAWYLFVSLLGLAAYPLLRFALPGLADRGYPLSRTVGLLLLGYLSWLAASTGFTYSRTTISVCLLLVLAAGVLCAQRQRAELLQEFRSRRFYFLAIETLTLGCYLVWLAVRVANPDLWHPARGGERPMDFSYLNAVIRSTTFPPYDPWFAGGYLNYYYFGFVLVGTPIKLLGIVPAIAYNVVLPTIFASIAAGAFSLGWNLFGAGSRRQRAAAGFAAAGFTILLGNLATLPLVMRWLRDLPVQRGEWYWSPSRVVPPGSGNEITEFPLFTMVHGDLHAHLLAIPLALLALSCALSLIGSRARPLRSTRPALALAALVLGALYPTNLADVYTYLALVLGALGCAAWRGGSGSRAKDFSRAAAFGIALIVLSQLLYWPYRTSYSQAYGAIELWRGPFTPVSSYLIHWGVPLFTIVCWMATESRNWMRSCSAAWLRTRTGVLVAAAGGSSLLVVLLLLASRGVTVGWFAVPVAAWAGLLAVRASISDAKRFVLLLVTTAFLITAVVEVVVVHGDIGRQNTVFKFYLQAWILLAISAGAAAVWTSAASTGWRAGWRLAWRTVMLLLIGGAGLFAITGTVDKVRDRWVSNVPRTLDAMTYMNYAHHEDFDRRMDLSEDYRAIRWMQENVPGSPVLVEAHCSEYRWCTRFTIYTGLPGVVGWNFHQRQQRARMSGWVTDRVEAVRTFYQTDDPDISRAFIDKYDVQYVVVGQLERAQYSPGGIAKFDRLDGQLWRAVYRDGNTTIYQSLR